jgi:putative transposase
MSNNKPQLVNDEIYHIVSRAVGDDIIFKNRDDYYRGIFSIYEFNNINPVTIREKRVERTKFKKSSRGPTSGESGENEGNGFLDKREKMVDILAFCFMPNHIHLLLHQLKDNGISQFMKKIGTGYAVYFNKKYNRKGHLFNKFKAIPIRDNDQLKNVFVYIHTNPISLVDSGWRNFDIKDSKKAIGFLEDYKWSSYQDYLGNKNFSSITTRDFLLEIIGSVNGCKKEVDSWIEYKERPDTADNFNSIILE